LLDALAALRASGTPVGVSLSGPGQGEALDRVLAVERDGARLFSTVQATWNVLEPSVGPMLRTAHEAGMGVIVKEAVANGRLAPRTGEKRVQRVLAPIAARFAVTIDAVALAAALDHPWVDVALSGAATAAHLRANLGAGVVQLTPDDRAALGALVEPPASYWAHRGDLAWA
jgi:aryl-alcohol dehydrogenase-like predicted oxidoreductase